MADMVENGWTANSSYEARTGEEVGMFGGGEGRGGECKIKMMQHAACGNRTTTTVYYTYCTYAVAKRSNSWRCDYHEVERTKYSKSLLSAKLAVLKIEALVLFSSFIGQ